MEVLGVLTTEEICSEETMEGARDRRKARDLNGRRIAMNTGALQGVLGKLPVGCQQTVSSQHNTNHSNMRMAGSLGHTYHCCDVTED